MPEGRPRRTRLDRLMVDRGLAPSRERAQALILAGRVLVDGQAAAKAGTMVPDGAPVVVTSPDHPFVGRGGVKLDGALATLGVDPADRVALDVGASTGGFTDCLLRRGARRVYALDVGAGQLDWSLRRDPRVVVLERVNARHLQPGDLPEAIDLAVVDVSFISLRLVLPPLRPLLAPGGRVVALVKPQFEVGRDDVGRGGIVRDAALHRRAVQAVAAAAVAAGFTLLGGCPSPLPGAEGNVEFFLLLDAAATPQGGLDPAALAASITGAGGTPEA
ncbi:MAG TPA: TlyA family RNA methyltransferase [Candidatus Polarisedimenticolia bacterium]|nr:TlyA family RNA methyltransferase [Candidatus Polarisedimenticolia bacterium]